MRAARVLTALAALTVLVGCDGGTDDPDPPTTDGVTSEAVTYAAPGGDLEAFRIRYPMTSVAGEATEATGVVAVPDGDPPDGGWPVIAWAHGTTGVADACTPTATDLAVDLAPIATLVGAGFVVVAPDYEGLGSPGDHPYLEGPSAARSVAGAVAAAAEVVEGPLADEWLVLGVSQGGHAALFTAELGEDAVPGMSLIGAVAVAPPTGLQPLVADRPADSALVALLLVSFLAAEPEVDPATVATPAGLEAIEAARATCSALLALAEDGADLLQPGAAELGSPFGDFVAATEPGAVATEVPILVVQGGADEVVDPATTATAVEHLCDAGDVVELRTYPDATHDSVLAAAAADIVAWTADRSAGRPAPSTC